MISEGTVDAFFQRSDFEVVELGSTDCARALKEFSDFDWDAELTRFINLPDDTCPPQLVFDAEAKSSLGALFIHTEELGRFTATYETLVPSKFLGIIPTKKVKSLNFQDLSKEDVKSAIEQYFYPGQNSSQNFNLRSPASSLRR